jgi:hypothetical protein
MAKGAEVQGAQACFERDVGILLAPDGVPGSGVFARLNQIPFHANLGLAMAMQQFARTLQMLPVFLRVRFDVFKSAAGHAPPLHHLLMSLSGKGKISNTQCDGQGGLIGLSKNVKLPLILARLRVGRNRKFNP